MINIKDGNGILFIGDSITDVKFNKWQNKKLKGRYNYPLQCSDEIKKHTNKTKFYYKGIASNRSYHVYDRLTADCISLKPDVIIMLIGVNDAWENYVPEQYPPLMRPFEPHMREIFRRIKTELPSSQLLVMLPFLIDTVKEKYPFHKVLDGFRKELKALAEEYGFETLDLQKVFNESQKSIEPKLLATDGVHPTQLGHRQIAESILKITQYNS